MPNSTDYSADGRLILTLLRLQILINKHTEMMLSCSEKNKALVKQNSLP